MDIIGNTATQPGSLGGHGLHPAAATLLPASGPASAIGKPKQAPTAFPSPVMGAQSTQTDAAQTTDGAQVGGGGGKTGMSLRPRQRKRKRGSNSPSASPEPLDGTPGKRQRHAHGLGGGRRASAAKVEGNPLVDCVFAPVAPLQWQFLDAQGHPLVPTFDVRTAKQLMYSEDNQSLLYYRRNHMEIVCNFEFRRSSDAEPAASGAAAEVAMIQRTDGSAPIPVEDAYVVVNGVGVSTNPLGEPTYVSNANTRMHIASRRRNAKIDLSPFPVTLPGTLSMQRLHFDSATRNNARRNGIVSPNQEFAAVMVSLVVMPKHPSAGTVQPMAVDGAAHQGTPLGGVAPANQDSLNTSNGSNATSKSESPDLTQGLAVVKLVCPKMIVRSGNPARYRADNNAGKTTAETTKTTKTAAKRRRKTPPTATTNDNPPAMSESVATVSNEPSPERELDHPFSAPMLASYPHSHQLPVTASLAQNTYTPSLNLMPMAGAAPPAQRAPMIAGYPAHADLLPQRIGATGVPSSSSPTPAVSESLAGIVQPSLSLYANMSSLSPTESIPGARRATAQHLLPPENPLSLFTSDDNLLGPHRSSSNNTSGSPWTSSSNGINHTAPAGLTSRKMSACDPLMLSQSALSRPPFTGPGAGIPGGIGAGVGMPPLHQSSASVLVGGASRLLSPNHPNNPNSKHAPVALHEIARPPLTQRAHTYSTLRNHTRHPWDMGANGNITHHGRIGINIEPTEALTVAGDARITGELVQPSDRRIKTNFTTVSHATQLDRLRRIKIYDFEYTQKWMQESGRSTGAARGVVAQELAQIIPEAVVAVPYSGHALEEGSNSKDEGASWVSSGDSSGDSSSSLSDSVLHSSNSERPDDPRPPRRRSRNRSHKRDGDTPQNPALLRTDDHGKMSGESSDVLFVVNPHALFMENVGATIHLAEKMESLEQRINLSASKDDLAVALRSTASQVPQIDPEAHHPVQVSTGRRRYWLSCIVFLLVTLVVLFAVALILFATGVFEPVSGAHGQNDASGGGDTGGG